MLAARDNEGAGEDDAGGVSRPFDTWGRLVDLMRRRFLGGPPAGSACFESTGEDDNKDAGRFLMLLDGVTGGDEVEDDAFIEAVERGPL